MKVIAVTGTPASGKSRLARRLAQELNYEYLELTSFLVKNGIYDTYDRALKTYIVDTSKMKRFLEPLLRKGDHHAGIVIDGHLSHELSPDVVDLVVVVRCDPKVLHRRLLLRKYLQKKVEENMEAEIMEVCETEARHLKHNVLVVDGTSFLRGNREKMIAAIKQKLLKRRTRTKVR